MWRSAARRIWRGSGPGGVFTLALAAIDIALWDIRGKALNQPLWKLLGGARPRVATYASGSLRRNLSLDEVVIAAGKLKEKGFREAKMQLALPAPTTPAKEVERAQAILAAMTDAQAKGLGAVSLNGVLIDAASIRQADAIVRQMVMIRERTGADAALSLYHARPHG